MEEIEEKKEKIEEKIDEIRLQNISFTYPYCNNAALKNISISLKKIVKLLL